MKYKLHILINYQKLFFSCIGTIDNIKAQIDTNRERERVCRAKRMKYEEISDTLHKKLENVLMCLCPLAIPGKDALSVIQEIENVMETFLRKIESDIYSKELTGQVRIFYYYLLFHTKILENMSN